jgi:hypothetical protein
MTLPRILLWILLAYFLYRFVFNFLAPLLKVSLRMRRQMKEFQRQHQQQGQFQDNATNAFDKNTTTQNNGPATKSKAGDYIDFEEVKQDK